MKREEPKQSPKEEDPKSRAQMEREDLKGGGPEMKRGAQRRTQKEEEEPKSRA